MPLYRKTDERLEAIPTTTFAAEKVLERNDLQRLLRRDLSPLGVRLLLLGEEYSRWQESSRRIDLLCLRADGAVVVVEIKRTTDGGHMELQSLRYAAMVARMTMQQAREAYAHTHGVSEEQAGLAIAAFLGSEFDEAEWAHDVAIILVSADFSSEITTSVLWLNTKDLDITCVRLRPYRVGDEILVDATQIIPLPEAADYTLTIRKQVDEKRQVLGERETTLRHFFTQLIARSASVTPLLQGRTASTAGNIAVGVGRTGINLWVTVKKVSSRVECYISLPQGQDASTRAFEHLATQREDIEAAFERPLDWQPLLDRGGCRICVDIEGGWTSPESEWHGIQDACIDALTRLDAALRPRIKTIPS
jgi:hypothetical protein